MRKRDEGNTDMEDAEDLQAQQTVITQLIKMRGTEVLKTPSLAKSIMADLTRNKQKGAVPAFYTMLEEINSGKSFSDEKAAQKFLPMIEKACRENGLGIPHEIVVAKEKIKVIVSEEVTAQRTETQENTVEPQAENKAEPKTTQPQATPQSAKKSNAGVICIVVIAVVFLGYMFVIKPQQDAKRIAEMQRLEAQRIAEMQRLEAQRKEETKQKTAEFIRELANNNVIHPPYLHELADAILQGDINAKDHFGWTALMYAVRYSPDIARLLIEAGADVNAKSNEGLTALMWVSEQEYLPAQVNLYNATLLINAGADVNAKESMFGTTALMYASRFGLVDVVRVLINAGANVNETNDSEQTALLYAFEPPYSHDAKTSIVTLLINAGINVNSGTDSYGDTPLMRAIKRNNPTAVKLIIDAGAVFNTKNRDGLTSLALAERLGYTQIAQMLRNAGATR